MRKIPAFFLTILLFVFMALSPSFSAAAEINQITDDSGKILLAGLNEGSIPELVEFLGHHGSSEANQAREALAEFGPKAVPELLNALEHEEYLDAVLPLLAQIGDARAIGPIFRIINSTSPEAANNARGALRGYGNAAVPTLLDGLNDANYYDASVDVLKDIHPDKDSLSLATKLVRDGNSKQRAAAVYLLGTWMDKGSTAVIENALKDDDTDVRTKAFEGYETLYSDEPARYNQKIILDLASDADPNIRKKAVRVIRDNFASKVVAVLEKMAKEDNDREVRYEATQALGYTHDISVIVPLLDVLLKENDEHILAGAVYALGELKADEGVYYIQGLFKDKAVGAELEAACIDTFIIIGKPVDVDPLLDFFDKGTPHEMWAFLHLIDTMAKPGDDKVVLALERFRPRAENQAMQEKIDSLLKKIKTMNK